MTRNNEKRGVRGDIFHEAEPNKFLTKTADSPRYASFFPFLLYSQPVTIFFSFSFFYLHFPRISFGIHLPEIQTLMVFWYYRDIYALPPMPDNIIHIDTCYSILAVCWYNTRKRGSKLQVGYIESLVGINTFPRSVTYKHDAIYKFAWIFYVVQKNVRFQSKINLRYQYLLKKLLLQYLCYCMTRSRVVTCHVML